MAGTFDWLDAVRRRFRQIESEPLPANIVALLRAAASDAPDLAAYHFIETGTEITYSELLAGVERLAAGFAGLGVSCGTHVAVMLPNIPEMPTTWLALAALGAVMVPVNTRYTAHELRYVLEDSQATHLIIHRDSVGLLPAGAGVQVIVAGAGAVPNTIRWDDLAQLGLRRGGAEPRARRQYSVHVGYDRLAQRMRADAALLADLREGVLGL